MVFLLAGCASFQAATDVQSGRQALLINKPEQALAYFEQAAENNPGYIYNAYYFSEGVWTYVGRTQYSLGKLQDAHRSLERALSVYPDDNLARLYLGLTLARGNDRGGGLKEINAGMKGLNDWLEHINATHPITAFWDPTHQIRAELQKDLAMIRGRDIDWPALIASGEWIGKQMEEEIDRVRRDEQRFRDREFDHRRGLSVGVGFGF